MVDRFRISKQWAGTRDVWFVYSADGVAGGPTRSGGWARQFADRADAEHACLVLNGRGSRPGRKHQP